jgi:hypothetical protein
MNAMVGMLTEAQIALRTFLDNVANLAIEGCLVADLRKLFTPAVVADFGDATVRKLFGEEEEEKGREGERENVPTNEASVEMIASSKQGADNLTPAGPKTAVGNDDTAEPRTPAAQLSLERTPLTAPPIPSVSKIAPTPSIGPTNLEATKSVCLSSHSDDTRAAPSAHRTHAQSRPPQHSQTWPQTAAPPGPLLPDTPPHTPESVKVVAGNTGVHGTAGRALGAQVQSLAEKLQGLPLSLQCRMGGDSDEADVFFSPLTSV